MKTRDVALAVLMLMVLGGWQTNKSSGTYQKTFSFASTGNVVPDSVRAGLTFISIADVGGAGSATIRIYSEDMDDSTLVTLGSGTAFEANCPHGIDSVVVATNATTLGFHLSN